MKRKADCLFLILTLTSVLLSPNCATLTRKRTQRIPVTSSPVGATVIVNSVHQGVTPLEIRLARKDKNQVIRIEYPGYNPLEIRARRSFFTSNAIINGFMGGIVGYWIAQGIYIADDHSTNGVTLLMICVPAAIGSLFLVDLATSTGYSFKPTDLIVTLTKADGPPRVDTMFVDADDLRNIKWIRVRRD